MQNKMQRATSELMTPMPITAHGGRFVSSAIWLLTRLTLPKVLRQNVYELLNKNWSRKKLSFWSELFADDLCFLAEFFCFLTDYGHFALSCARCRHLLRHWRSWSFSFNFGIFMIFVDLVNKGKKMKPLPGWVWGTSRRWRLLSVIFSFL